MKCTNLSKSDAYTDINGVRLVDEAVLKDGDEISIGGRIFRFAGEKNLIFFLPY